MDARVVASSLRECRDRAYARLSHEARRVFDVACAERVLALFESRHAGDGRVRRALQLAPMTDSRLADGELTLELERLRDDLYVTSQAMSGSDDHSVRVACAVIRAAVAAATPSVHGLANSDYAPTSASEAINARYLATCIDNGYDLDAADRAVHDELRWQVERLDNLLHA